MNAESDSEYASRLGRLLSDWKGISKTYTLMLWQARYVASRARVASEEFLTSTYAIDSTMNPASFRPDLGNYSMTDLQVSSREIIDELTALSTHVDDFYNTFSQIWPDEHLNSPHETYSTFLGKSPVTRLCKSIRELHLQLLSMLNRIRRVSMICVEGGANAISLDLDFSFRNAQAENVGGGERFYVAPQSPAFAEITSHLSIVLSIWAAVQADLDFVNKSYLNAMCTTIEPHMDPVFMERIRMCRNMYSSLSIRFLDFEAGVRDDTPILKRRVP
ncbi:unnamed protein product [Somion occarium]